MSKLLVDNIHRMSNPEIIGLAKNRWLPEEVQMAIAKHPYTRGHWYLAENAGLQSSVRDYLWSDDCNKGYTLKTTLIAYGHYFNEPEKYTELYERYPSAWSRSRWRISHALLGSYYRNRESSNTPTALLHRIYDDKLAPSLSSGNVSRYGGYGHASIYELERLARHPNVDLKLAIKLSQCGVDSIQKHGFTKIVELS